MKTHLDCFHGFSVAQIFTLSTPLELGSPDHYLDTKNVKNVREFPHWFDIWHGTTGRVGLSASAMT